MSEPSTSQTETSKPRPKVLNRNCDKILKISRESMFVRGLYRCTLQKDHDKGKDATPHRSVVSWTEKGV